MNTELMDRLVVSVLNVLTVYSSSKAMDNELFTINKMCGITNHMLVADAHNQSLLDP